jgi:type I restriction enzyme S subunit
MTEIKIPMVPQLRFVGFSEEWGEVKMGELLSFKNGYNAGAEQYGSGVKFINVLDIIENDFITHDRIIGSVQIPPKDFEKNEVKFGDILFQRSSETREEVGQANVYLDRDKSATFGGFVIRGKPLTEFNSVFFNSMLKTAKARKDITSRSGGSTRYNIGQESLENTVVSIAPTLLEQRKIAGFLTAVDGRIGQLIEKKALLEQYKKGVMQQLFAQTLRFKDDQGNPFPDWEEKKLGEVASFSKGRGICKDDVHEDGVTPCIRYGELYTHYSELIGEVKSRTNVEKKNLVLSQRNDVIIPASGETHIDIATASCVMEEGIALGGDLNIIRAKTNGVFLAYYLNNAMKHAIAGMAQGSSVIHLYPAQLKLLKLVIPPYAEQTKIAEFLSSLDRKIEQVAGQIAETQTFKRGLLQQMFV